VPFSFTSDSSLRFKVFLTDRPWQESATGESEKSPGGNRLSFTMSPLSVDASTMTRRS